MFAAGTHTHRQQSTSKNERFERVKCATQTNHKDGSASFFRCQELDIDKMQKFREFSMERN